MEKLFDAIVTGYDPKNKPVHLCKNADGKFYVYKPSSGFKSRLFDAIDDESLKAIYERQVHDGQTFASYLPGEAEEVVVETPAAPVVEALMAPVVPTPEAPVVEAPMAPVVPTPEAPVVEAPMAPVASTPEVPVVEEPKTPVTGTENTGGSN